MAIGRAWAIGLVLVGCAGAALSAPQDNRTGGPSDAILGNLDALIDNYSMLLVRKYDLDDQQADFTKRLLHERVKSFFAAHEHEVRDLMDRMFDARAGGEMAQSDLIDWGRRVSPLFEEAKQIIVQSNHDWRQVLTDEQRKIHDKDVDLMNESFDTTGQQLQRLVSGEMTVEEFRNPFRPARRVAPRPRLSTTPIAGATPAANAPVNAPTPEVRPVEPQAASGASLEEENAAAVNRRTGEQPPARVTREPRRGAEQPAEPDRPARGARRGEIARPVSDKDFAGKWEQYVRDFIARYQLDEGQKQRAEAYLKDCLQQGERYMQTKLSQIERVDAEVAELAKSTDKNKTAQIAKLAEQRKKLLEPLDRIFEGQLKPRLDKLPTRAQRAAAEEADKKPPAKTSGNEAKPAPQPRPPTKDDE